MHKEEKEIQQNISIQEKVRKLKDIKEIQIRQLMIYNLKILLNSINQKLMKIYQVQDNFIEYFVLNILLVSQFQKTIIRQKNIKRELKQQNKNLILQKTQNYLLEKQKNKLIFIINMIFNIFYKINIIQEIFVGYFFKNKLIKNKKHEIIYY